MGPGSSCRPGRLRRIIIYAVIRSGGKQYRVERDQLLDVDLIDGEVGSTVKLNEVLLVANNGDVQIGTPTVDGAVVEAEIVEHGRDKKLRIFKYKAKTRYRRRIGHRTHYTRLAIKRILQDGEETVAAETEEKPRPKAKRPSRRTKKAEAETTTPEPTAEAPEPTAAEAPEPTAEAEAPAAEAEAPSAEAATDTETKPKTAKKRTTKRKAAKADDEEGGSPAETKASTGAEKPSRRRTSTRADKPAGTKRRTKKSEGPASEDKPDEESGD